MTRFFYGLLVVACLIVILGVTLTLPGPEPLILITLFPGGFLFWPTMWAGLSFVYQGSRDVVLWLLFNTWITLWLIKQRFWILVRAMHAFQVSLGWIFQAGGHIL